MTGDITNLAERVARLPDAELLELRRRLLAADLRPAAPPEKEGS